mmetsp:Transcript_3243/g.6682  ORF Transcript_3243/g.6682 Transcript_3243/m.6682 type:complete len:287 (-) Transcript_3243:33-893(-)
MKFLHVHCLQEWLKNRLISRHTEQSLYYCWKALDCELCKQTLPSAVTVQGKTYNLITVVSPDTPFIILESFKREQAVTRGVHLIKFLDLQPVIIGRGNESDVRLSNDISVSRCHASIRLVKDGLLLEDRSSKFGTLLQKRKAIVMNPGSSLAIQVNRTVLQISNPVVWTFKSFCARLCCFKSNKVRHCSTISMESAVSEPSAHSSSRPMTSARPLVPDITPDPRLQLNLDNLPMETEPLQMSHQFTVREQFMVQSNPAEKELVMLSHRDSLHVNSEAPIHPAYNSF